MCRLLAYAAPAASTFSDVIGTSAALSFQRLAHLHDDGWGVVWTTPEGLRRERRTDSGSRDARLSNALNGTRARAAVAHLRLATGGLSVRTENTHPFMGRDARGSDVGFAHNGSILPVADLRALVSEAALRECRGTTDSELYFALVRERLADGLDLGEAVTATVHSLRTRFPAASLNAMALDDRRLVVVRASTDAVVPTEHFAERGIDGDDLPPEHDEGYYALRVWRGADGSLAFASSGLDTTGWEELPRDSVTVVDLATVTMRTYTLSTTETGSFAVIRP